MKLIDMLDVIERVMKDAMPRSSYYAEALRFHMVKRHKEMLNEEIILE